MDCQEFTNEQKKQVESEISSTTVRLIHSLPPSSTEDRNKRRSHRLLLLQRPDSLVKLSNTRLECQSPLLPTDTTVTGPLPIQNAVSPRFF
jgi:hypothetical protein